MLKNKVPYKELGETYLDSRWKKNMVKSYTNRLKKSGYEVALKEMTAS